MWVNLKRPAEMEELLAALSFKREGFSSPSVHCVWLGRLQAACCNAHCNSHRLARLSDPQDIYR